MTKAQLPPLNLSAASPKSDGLQHLSPSTLSPRSPRSPRTPGSVPGSPFLQSAHSQSVLDHVSYPIDAMTATSGQPPNGPTSPSMTATPEFPPSAPTSPKHGREPSKSFFSNLMASKSSHKLRPTESSAPENPDRLHAKSRTSSKDRSLHSLRTRGSTPDLPRMQASNEKVSGNAREEAPTAVTNVQPENGPYQQLASRKAKSRFGGLLNRTKSIRVDDDASLPTRPQRRPSHLNLEAQDVSNGVTARQYTEPLRTAPVRSDHRDHAFSDEIGSTNRNRSADRRPPAGTLHEDPASERKERVGTIAQSHSFKDGGTLTLLSNIQQSGKGMGDRLGRAGKGFLGKITRSDSSNQRDLLTDDSYKCTVINLPLVKQTRKTRIARRLDLSKDKTEYWMPALPWRCIDYLNMNGCEEEGLYRIPGSGRDVKHWQRRFDSEYDINLFDEPELYDINTIGSMFKSWLRELPDEILPKATQARIAEQCKGATRTPQLLKDELSKLPPFHYYLLFAITCHLSLLHGFADKNKMDYRNLCICFQPCLKIDGFCFQFLVQDWKSCWQGCWTEKEYLEEEVRYDREGSINEGENGNDEHSADERAVSSSGSSQHAPVAEKRAQSATRTTYRAVPSVETHHKSKSNGNTPRLALSQPTASVTITQLPAGTDESRDDPPKTLPELKHLSPLKF